MRRRRYVPPNPDRPGIDTVKSDVRGRDGHRCTKCGMTAEQHMEQYGRQLHVHRLRPGSLYTMDGCITICQGCHGAEPKREEGQIDEAHPDVEPRESFHLSEALAIALCEYTSRVRPETSKSAVIRLALEEFLHRAGYWDAEGDGA